MRFFSMEYMASDDVSCVTSPRVSACVRLPFMFELSFPFHKPVGPPYFQFAVLLACWLSRAVPQLSLSSTGFVSPTAFMDVESIWAGLDDVEPERSPVEQDPPEAPRPKKMRLQASEPPSAPKRKGQSWVQMLKAAFLAATAQTADPLQSRDVVIESVCSGLGSHTLALQECRACA